MKDIKNRIDQVKEENLRLMGVFLIVLLITFITVILVYFIGLYKYNKTVGDDESKQFYLKARVIDSYFELLTFDNDVSLNDKCSESCMFKTGVNNSYTYYQISKLGDTYVLSINLLYQYVGEFNIGNDISNLIISKWNDYDTFKFIYKDSVSEYDEVIFVNRNKTDVITSKGVNEIEFINDKVLYNSYSCFKGDNTNAVVFRNEKTPFSETSEILSYENTNLNNC